MACNSRKSWGALQKQAMWALLRKHQVFPVRQVPMRNSHEKGPLAWESTPLCRCPALRTSRSQRPPIWCCSPLPNPTPPDRLPCTSTDSGLSSRPFESITMVRTALSFSPAASPFDMLQSSTKGSPIPSEALLFEHERNVGACQIFFDM